MAKLNRFDVGDKAEFKHTITEEDLKKFVELTGDNNPLHIDPEFAGKTVFKGIVAHGMLGASFISTVIGKYILGEGALWVSQSINFLLPVRINDELTIFAEITKKNVRHQLLTLKVEIKNQYQRIVLNGESKVKVVGIEEPNNEFVKTVEKKVVLITGASGGIGSATAIHLAKKGFAVAINYYKNQQGAQRVNDQILKEGGEAILCPGDVTNNKVVQEMVKSVVRKYGVITSLVNNASTRIVPQEFGLLQWEDIQVHLDTHVKGAFNCIRAVLDGFIKNGYGNIVNIGSIYSDSTPPLNLTGYVIAKNALNALTKSLSMEYGPKGIRVNNVSPGMTDTALTSETPEKTRLVTAMQTPLRRLAKPEDIACAISFLLGDDSRYITGETLRVCGGKVML